MKSHQHISTKRASWKSYNLCIVLKRLHGYNSMIPQLRWLQSGYMVVTFSQNRLHFFQHRTLAGFCFLRFLLFCRVVFSAVLIQGVEAHKLQPQSLRFIQIDNHAFLDGGILAVIVALEAGGMVCSLDVFAGLHLLRICPIIVEVCFV